MSRCHVHGAAVVLPLLFACAGCGTRSVDGWVPTHIPIESGGQKNWTVWTAPGAPIWFGYGAALARIADDEFSLEPGVSALLTDYDSSLGPFGGTGPANFWMGSVLHYDGSTWRRDTSTWPGAVGPRTMNGAGEIYCADFSHCWLADTTGGLLFFNGGAWQPQDSPNEGVAVHGTSKDDVHIIGRRKLHHFDGKTWSQTGALANEQISLVGVWARSPTEAYAATGERLLRYDGVRWLDLPAPKGTISRITGCGEELYLATETEVFERTSSGSYAPALHAPEKWRVSCLFCSAGVLIACTHRYDAQGREVIVWVRR